MDPSEKLPDAWLGRARASRQQHMKVTHKVLQQVSVYVWSLKQCNMIRYNQKQAKITVFLVDSLQWISTCGHVCAAIKSKISIRINFICQVCSGKQRFWLMFSMAYSVLTHNAKKGKESVKHTAANSTTKINNQKYQCMPCNQIKWPHKHINSHFVITLISRKRSPKQTVKQVGPNKGIGDKWAAIWLD